MSASLRDEVQSIVARIGREMPAVAILLPHRKKIDFYEPLGAGEDWKTSQWFVVWEDKGSWRSQQVTPAQKQQFLDALEDE